MYKLRHTFASHLTINGTPIFMIKEQTIRYAKLAPDSGKKNVLNLYR